MVRRATATVLTVQVQHAYLGVSVTTPGEGSGAEVASVKSGSPAAEAGLKAGDVITSFDGRMIASPEDLTDAVSAKRPGDQVTITYRGDGPTKTVDVTVGNRSS